MRTDQQGVTHPTRNDPVEKEGLMHIASCPECQADYVGEVADLARQVRDAEQ